jgi:hypothetical protein
MQKLLVLVGVLRAVLAFSYILASSQITSVSFPVCLLGEHQYLEDINSQVSAVRSTCRCSTCASEKVHQPSLRVSSKTQMNHGTEKHPPRSSFETTSKHAHPDKKGRHAKPKGLTKVPIKGPRWKSSPNIRIAGRRRESVQRRGPLYCPRSLVSWSIIRIP